MISVENSLHTEIRCIRPCSSLHRTTVLHNLFELNYLGPIKGDVGVGRARSIMQTVGESQRKKSEPATVKKKKTPDIPSSERLASTSSTTSRGQRGWDVLEGAKRQFVEELEQKAGEEFGHHIERLKMIPFEAKATSTAAAYKAENDKRNSWISQKKLPMDESSFLFYLLDRAKQIGSSALAKISAAYQTANEGISAIGASFVSDIIKSKRREESLLKKEVVKVTMEDVQKITMLAMKEERRGIETRCWQFYRSMSC
ncbi:hypothetical protein L3Y34_014029 [Caenorhabditis briggsae]|uniref:Uncharacterized protein n=2 Tax=Caenorhabditis briggsae TaxID=6238 RepID=A0AAE9DPM1_CAEBR|nr:hypothetical protein L3Y34_014029 [Caenorhabditis briggsae]